MTVKLSGCKGIPEIKCSLLAILKLTEILQFRYFDNLT